MEAVVSGILISVCAFCGVLLGMFLRAVLPKNHLDQKSLDVIKISSAMIATLTALVLGLLTASAKNSFDSKDAALKRSATNVILLDRTLAQYGPETKDLRELGRQIVMMRLRQIWPEEEGSGVNFSVLSQDSTAVELIQQRVLRLSPHNDAQRWLQSKSLQLTAEIAETRWQILSQLSTGIEWAFLVVLAFWIAVIFASFGLVAPRNRTVLAALIVCAVSVGGSVYLIVQMSQPYSGLIKISSAPLRNALVQMGQP